MSGHLFEFIQSEDEELAVLGEHIEKRLYSDTQSVMIKSRIFVERIINKTIELEEFNVQLYPTLIDRINKLDRAGILTDYVVERLHWLRKAGNNASHNAEIPKVEVALKAHRFLFDIAVWFKEIYDYTFEVPEYHLPYQDEHSLEPNKINELINWTVKETIDHAVDEKFSHWQINQNQLQNNDSKDGESTKPTTNESTSDEQDFKPIAYLRSKGFAVIDKREKGGTVWVVGSWDDRSIFYKLKKHKFYFRFATNGSRSTKNRPAWFMLNKSYNGELGIEEEQEAPTYTQEEVIEDKTVEKRCQIQKKKEVKKPELKTEVVLIEVPFEMEQVSEQIAIPSHLLNKEINQVLNRQLSDVTNILGLYKFKEINDDQLRRLFTNQQSIFFNMMTGLWLLGIRFSKKLAKLVKLPEEHPQTVLKLNGKKDEELRNSLNFYLSDKLNKVGMVNLSDLDLIPIESIDWLLGKQTDDFKEQILESLKIKDLSIDNMISQNNDTTKMEDESEVSVEEKVITLDEKMLTIPANLAGMKMTYDKFENCQNVIKKLNEKAIYYIHELPRQLGGDFHKELKNVGPRAVEKFWETLIELLNVEKKDVSEEYQGYRVTLEGEEIIFCDYMQHRVIENDEKIFSSMPAMINLFKQNNIIYYRDLPYNLIKIKELKGVGLGKVQQIFQILKAVNEFYTKEEEFQEQINGLNEEELTWFFLNNAKRKVDEVFNNKQKQEDLKLNKLCLPILEQRFEGYQNGESVTLQNLGDQFGVTRERIRQITAQNLDKLKNIEPRWANRLIEQIKDKQLVKNKYFNTNEFIDFVFIQILENNNNVNYIEGWECFTLFSDTRCKEIRKEITKALEEDFKKRMFGDEELEAICHKYAEEYQLSNDIVKTIIEDRYTKTNLGDKYVLKNISKHDAAQILATRYPDGLDVYKDIEQIAEELNLIVPGYFKADRATATLFLTSQDCYLWGRGRYIHKKYVNFDAPILDKVMEKAIRVVNERGILSVNRLYQDYEEQLTDSNIPNEYALYTVLREKGSNDLSFIKFPKIYPAGADQKENSEIIKDYIRRKGEPVTSKELRNHFMKTLGWKKFTIEFSISNDLELISCDWGKITVLDMNPEISIDKQQIIQDKIKKSLKENDVIQIKKIFVHHESLCKSMKIDNSFYLYNVLKYYFSEEIHYFRYPYITEYGREFDSMTNLNLVEEFVKDEQAEVSREEIYDWMINELGGVEGTVHNVLTSSNELLNYTKGRYSEIIHKDVIGWNVEKENQLVQTLEDKTCEFRHDIENPFINIDHIFNGIELTLPKLDNDVLWTADLIVELLKRSTQHSLVLIGSSDKIIVNRQLFRSIIDNKTFIEHLLLYPPYRGSAKLTEFKSMLGDIGYSSKGELLYEVELAIREGRTPLSIYGNEIIYDGRKVRE